MTSFEMEATTTNHNHNHRDIAVLSHDTIPGDKMVFQDRPHLRVGGCRGFISHAHNTSIRLPLNPTVKCETSQPSGRVRVRCHEHVERRMYVRCLSVPEVRLGEAVISQALLSAAPDVGGTVSSRTSIQFVLILSLTRIIPTFCTSTTASLTPPTLSCYCPPWCIALECASCAATQIIVE